MQEKWFKSINNCIYIKQLFKRVDFPLEILVAIDHTINIKKGDVIYASNDCEDAFDFTPLPRIDELVTNLPSKEEFLRKLGVQEMNDVTPEKESEFWDEFEFEFAESVSGVKIIWK